MKHINEYKNWKPSSTTGDVELDNYIKSKFGKYEIYPSYADAEIFVGYLRGKNDHTWNDVYTYYYNNNFEIEEMSSSIGKKIKL